MSFNFGNQGTQPTTGLNLGQQQQQAPAFGFSNPQMQGFQFGTTAPTLGFGTQPTATTSAPNTGFSFAAPATGLSFGTPNAFGAPAANPAPASTFGPPSFGTTPVSGTSSGFSFAQPTAGPALGTAGAFGNTFGTAATTAPFFSSSSGGSFSSFGQTTTPAAMPQFGAAISNPTATSQPFSFGTPVTSATGPFGGTGFTLGSAPAPTSQAQGLFPGGSVFGGFGTSSNAPIAAVAPAPSGGFQLTSAPSMPILSATTTSSVAPGALPFGTTPTGLSFDTSTPSQGFNFGATPTSISITPFATPISSGLNTNTMTASIAPTIKTNAAPAGAGFGTLPSFSAATATSTAPTSGLNFGIIPSATKISLTGFTPTVTSATTSAPGLAFALPTQPSPALGITTTATSVLSVTTAAPPAATTTAPFSLGTSSLFTPSFSKLPTTSATSSAVTTTTTTTTSTAVVFPSSGLPSLLASTTPSISPSTTATDTTVTVVQVGSQMTFRQLEEAINKWNLELSDQERIFLNQATQVNAWDRLLITNGQKIKDLHESVERVKLEQERLDHELDFIVSQQRELEDLLVPLEKALDDTPALSIQQHADLQREHTYHMAEKVDGQLKRMAEDIKEIIEHLNTSQNQDDTDPMQQVSKILNAHMDALHWVDQNTELLQKKLEEISKVVDSTKKDQDRSWRISYN